MPRIGRVVAQNMPHHIGQREQAELLCQFILMGVYKRAL
jgi:hypothetical protein